jgi:hypothetical protein
MYYYTALLITVSLQLATRHFGKYLVALGTNLFFWETHLGVFGASPRSFGWHLGRPRSQPLSLCDAPPNLGESLAGGALLVAQVLMNATIVVQVKASRAHPPKMFLFDHVTHLRQNNGIVRSQNCVPYSASAVGSRDQCSHFLTLPQRKQR